jgi:uncharacterized integral membrane protein
MRTLKMLILILMALVLIVLGVANLDPVDVHLLPAEIGGPQSVIPQIPLAAVILIAVVFGVLVGYLLEWLREAKHRRLADEKKREVSRLRKEISLLNARLGESESDIPEFEAR